MEITKPHYYDRFSCLAGACPDTCCANWEVVIDADAMAYYQSVPGELGERLREAMVEADGEICFGLTDGLCRLLRPDGLCPIQAELGEAHLCKICGLYPRYSTEIGLRRDIGLTISCPEAARLILTEGASLTLLKETTAEPMSSLHEISPALILTMEALRDHALCFAQDRTVPFSARCVKILRLCAPPARAGKDSALKAALARGLSDTQSSVTPAGIHGIAHLQAALLAAVEALEPLRPAWQTLLYDALARPLAPLSWEALCPTVPNAFEQLLCYGICKYFPRAAFDRGIWQTAVFCVMLPLLLRQLMAAQEDRSEAELLRLAWSLSREVEHSQENMAALFRAFSGRAFRPAALEAVFSSI